ncbi:MAG TPA: hypothetical protein VET51_03640 [Burkholderiales bacterium]|nr:hypothetical protein [Burkholderiales bacterium]
MPIKIPRFPLLPRFVLDAPELPGVIALWELDQLIYLGRSTPGFTIRKALMAHQEARYPCTAAATHFAWEAARDPAARERELLAEYFEEHRGFPRCNAAET